MINLPLRFPSTLFLRSYLNHLLYNEKESVLILRWSRNLTALEGYNSSNFNILKFSHLNIDECEKAGTRDNFICIDDEDDQIKSKLTKIFLKDDSLILKFASTLNFDRNKSYPSQILNLYPINKLFNSNVVEKDANTLTSEIVKEYLSKGDSITTEEQKKLAYTWIRVYIWLHSTILGF